MTKHPDPFKPAVRERLPVKLALYGPSKAGKTYSALLIARGIVGEEGRIAVLDTENGRSRMYADEIPGGFNVLKMGEPFSPDRFISGMQTALDAGYDCLIIDGATPEWEYVKELAERSQKGKNEWSGWAVATPAHQTFLKAITGFPRHLIVTTHVRTEWAIGEGNKPIEVGLAPEQRRGWEYEFDLVGLVDQAHELVFKARGEMDGRVVPPAVDPVETLVSFGAVLAEWMGHGEEDLKVEEFDPDAALPVDQIQLDDVVPD